MKYSKLYEVRCPNTEWKGNSKNYKCSTLCGKVTADACGEFWCRKCKILFQFIINDEGEVWYLSYGPSTRRVDRRKMTTEDRTIDLIDNQ